MPGCGAALGRRHDVVHLAGLGCPPGSPASLAQVLIALKDLATQSTPRPATTTATTTPTDPRLGEVGVLLAVAMALPGEVTA